MPLKLEVCTDNDMPRAFAILSSAFGHEHPYIEACFPEHDQPEGRKVGGERMLAIKHADPNTTLLKVTDTESGEMMAFAKWNIYDSVVPEEVELEGDFWPGQDEKEYAQHLFRQYLVPRRKAIRESGGRLLWKSSLTQERFAAVTSTALDILVVDPGCQRRGAGRMLVKWGTAIADQMKVQAVVEATDYGRPLYESEGFNYVYHHVVDLPEKWAGRDRQKFIWMVRPVKGGA
ncbi:MAG: hypothetical protein Q9163_002310 [Psora crenata]